MCGGSCSRRAWQGWLEDSDGGSEAAPKNVSKSVPPGTEFRITNGQTLRSRVWLDSDCSALSCFHPDSQKSLLFSAGTSDLKGRGPSNRLLSKAVVSGFLGALPWLRKRGWAVQGGAQGSGHQPHHSPRGCPAAHVGQPGSLCGEATFWACQFGAWGPAKARYNLASEEVAERASDSFLILAISSHRRKKTGQGQLSCDCGRCI